MNQITTTKIAIFRKKEIRKIIHKNEWWFVIEDVVLALTNSAQPKGYIKDMRRRDKELSKGWVQIATPLEIKTIGGPQKLNCANTEGIFRIIQSIPSLKTEPFKRWLARVGNTGFGKSKNVVIAGSTSLQKEMNKWAQYWSGLDGHLVIGFPKPIPKDNFDSLYPNVHKEFFEKIVKTDILFIANEDKNNISGYIGAETFAEMAFGVAQNLLYNKKIKIILAKMPSKEVQCFDEVVLWRKLGWIYEIKAMKI